VSRALSAARPDRAAGVGAVDVVLPEEAVRQLNAAVEFDVGFPSDFIAECEADPWVFGEANARLVGRSGPESS
jgi:hypothetical protein